MIGITTNFFIGFMINFALDFNVGNLRYLWVA
jgi:hypothetical protein